MNTSRRLSFSGRQVTAEVFANARDLRLDGPSIVLNAGVTDVLAGECPRKPIHPLCSTLLTGTRVDGADLLVVLRTPSGSASRPADIVTEPGWRLLGDILGGATDVTGGRPFDPKTPLWRNSQDTVGRIAFDPAHLLGEAAAPGTPEPFDVKVNLWFAPAGTDCFIHKRHDFIEVHTQILGTGRMQKFREQDHSTLYEDVVMSPGWTTPQPFCGIGPDGGFHYPWHQYHADTDCVWLAVEYHRTTTPGDSS
ncbi:hypothetical protein [Actinomadura rubrisoli]|uniref:Uncharacterized protein n=1 Tax=Actinomadura rubrisoli TaxID=2530368 RepID=A0A4R5BH87_9ACTN|nr:hypothetical protein [Actinomadura rubrisoli]TDD83194.1 hypothetical protein E1298_21600 [Actinomadura rubrisoli]